MAQTDFFFLTSLIGRERPYLYVRILPFCDHISKDTDKRVQPSEVLREMPEVPQGPGGWTRPLVLDLCVPPSLRSHLLPLATASPLPIIAAEGKQPSSLLEAFMF